MSSSQTSICEPSSCDLRLAAELITVGAASYLSHPQSDTVLPTAWILDRLPVEIVLAILDLVIHCRPRRPNFFLSCIHTSPRLRQIAMSANHIWSTIVNRTLPYQLTSLSRNLLSLQSQASYPPQPPVRSVLQRCIERGDSQSLRHLDFGRIDKPCLSKIIALLEALPRIAGQIQKLRLPTLPYESLCRCRGCDDVHSSGPVDPVLEASLYLVPQCSALKELFLQFNKPVDSRQLDHWEATDFHARPETVSIRIHRKCHHYLPLEMETVCKKLFCNVSFLSLTCYNRDHSAFVLGLARAVAPTIRRLHLAIPEDQPHGLDLGGCDFPRLEELSVAQSVAPSSKSSPLYIIRAIGSAKSEMPRLGVLTIPASMLDPLAAPNMLRAKIVLDRGTTSGGIVSMLSQWDSLQTLELQIPDRSMPPSQTTNTILSEVLTGLSKDHRGQIACSQLRSLSILWPPVGYDPEPASVRIDMSSTTYGPHFIGSSYRKSELPKLDSSLVALLEQLIYERRASSLRGRTQV